MEAGTAPPTTGSKTIADLMPRAAEHTATSVALRHKVDGEWHDVTFAEVGEIVSRDRPRPDRPGHPARRARLACSPTRARNGPTAPSRLSGAGGGRRPDLPDQLARGVRVGRRELRVGRRHLRGRRAGREDRRRPRARCPPCATIIVIDPAGDIGRRGRARRAARARPRARRRASSSARTAAVGPEDPFTFIYTSGTTGPPKGCVLTHGNYRVVLTMVEVGGLRSTRTRSSTSSCRSPTPSRCSSSSSTSTSAPRSPTAAATRSRSSPSSWRSSRPTCRRCRASSRSSTRSRSPHSRPRSGQDAGRRQARRQGPRHRAARRGGAARPAAPFAEAEGSSSRTCAPLRRPRAPGGHAAPRRSPRRSSSSSTAAASRSSRATA